MGREAFAKAVSKVLLRYAQREIKVVDVADIWLDTSIPRDFIIELFRENLVEIPEGVEKVKDGKRILWRRT